MRGDGVGGHAREPRTCVCVAIEDPILRRRVDRALVGVAGQMVHIDSIAAPEAVRRSGDEQLLIVLGSRIGGVDLTPAAVHRLRAAEPLVPILVCLPSGHLLQRR